MQENKNKQTNKIKREMTSNYQFGLKVIKWFSQRPKLVSAVI